MATFAHIKYSDDMPEKFGGITRFWFVTIRPKYKDDAGLLRHELTHVQQFWDCLFISMVILLVLFMTLQVHHEYYWLLLLTPATHGIFYATCRSYRFMVEVDAYANQLNVYKATDIPFWVQNAIMTKYGLNVTVDQINAAIVPRLRG